MDVVDLDPARIAGGPDAVRTVLSGRFEHGGVAVLQVDLRLYWEDGPGGRCLITCLVLTDGGSVESVYDEGDRDPDPISGAAGVIGSAGISPLIERSLISLRGARVLSHFPPQNPRQT